MMQQEYLGFKSLNSLKQIFKDNRITSVFVISGKTSFQAVKEVLTPLLGDRKTGFFQLSSSPLTPEEIKAAIKEFRLFPYEAVAVIGGGKVLDAGKLINTLGRQEGPCDLYLNGEKTVTKRGPILISCPTTRGWGSEATSFAFWNAGNRPGCLNHPYLLSDYVILDPEISITPSKELKVLPLFLVLDSWLSLKGNEESRSLGERVITLYKKEEPGALIECERAYLAGRCQNITGPSPALISALLLEKDHNLSISQLMLLTIRSFLVLNGGVNKKTIVNKKVFNVFNKTRKQLIKLFTASSFVEFIGIVDCSMLSTIFPQEMYTSSIIDSQLVDKLLINMGKLFCEKIPYSIKTIEN